MEKQVLEIQAIEKVTHNVLRFTLEDSDQVEFTSGQASEIAIDKDGWRDKGRPFTFTSLPEEDHLEFTIKIYPDHGGVTNELSKLQPGDHLILKDVFGAIHYKGDGTFLAGGAGVTPFISIIRNLAKQGKLEGNQLIFANDKEKDIINHEEFRSLLGQDFSNILAKEEKEDYAYGFIDTEYLKEQIDSFDQYFYICGPPAMMDAVEESLKELGVSEEQMVKEKFN
ncbi:MAG: FAD-binding oxidoreductase [Atopostipes suicloacalis]|nr:FAD-binding oxidoreductase [Atopostipes suicloacalis]